MPEVLAFYLFVYIRQLAEALGCSTQPSYLSFSGMDELRVMLIPLAVAEFENFIYEKRKRGRRDQALR